MNLKKLLIDFEEKIANNFNKGLVRSPVHLTYGNEDFLIKFFKKIKKKDWIFCSWRSHYHCLLKGVPSQQVKDEILTGKSISLCFPKYRSLLICYSRGESPNCIRYCFIDQKK